MVYLDKCENCHVSHSTQTGHARDWIASEENSLSRDHSRRGWHMSLVREKK